MARTRCAAMYDDMEEYHSLIDSSRSICSDTTIDASMVSAADETLPPPPLEEPMAGAVHMNMAHCRTVLGSMQQAVPIVVHESQTKTKRSGLFYAGEMSVPAGQMLFLTHPTSMVHAHNAGPGVEVQTGNFPGGQAGRGHAREVCDYCFKGPDAVVETDQGRFVKGHAAQRCTGCFVLSFCDRTCQRKAWRLFHKYECGLLREMRACDPISLMLLRLLVLDEANCIPANVMATMQALTDPPVLSDDAGMKRHIQNCAASIHSTMSCTKRNRQFVRDLLRRVIGNHAFITRADASARVLCFDVALANLNHSCDPNAFVFVEGRQARVRTARRIAPGEEITVGLVDLHLDVISRNNNLKLYTAASDYVCPCRDCKIEMDTISSTMPRDIQERTMLFLRDAQLVPRATQLMAAITDEVWDDRRRELIKQLASLADEDYNNCRGVDPEQDRPRVWMRMAVASLYFAAGDLENALHYALRAFFFQDHRATPDTVADLRVLANILVAVSELPETDKQYKRMFGGRRKSTYEGFPDPEAFRVFASGCLTLYQQAAVMVFGPKLSFVRSALHWGRDKEMLCHPVIPGTTPFDFKFDATQQQLVNWSRGGKTDVYAPLRPPTVAQLQQVQMLMDSLDDKRGGDAIQQDEAAMPKGHRLNVSEDEGYQGDADTASQERGLELQWIDKNQSPKREEVREEGAKKWPTDAVAAVAAAC